MQWRRLSTPQVLVFIASIVTAAGHAQTNYPVETVSASKCDGDPLVLAAEGAQAICTWFAVDRAGWEATDSDLKVHLTPLSMDPNPKNSCEWSKPRAGLYFVRLKFGQDTRSLRVEVNIKDKPEVRIKSSSPRSVDLWERLTLESASELKAYEWSVFVSAKERKDRAAAGLEEDGKLSGSGKRSGMGFGFGIRPLLHPPAPLEVQEGIADQTRSSMEGAPEVGGLGMASVGTTGAREGRAASGSTSGDSVGMPNTSKGEWIVVGDEKSYVDFPYSKRLYRLKATAENGCSSEDQFTPQYFDRHRSEFTAGVEYGRIKGGEDANPIDDPASDGTSDSVLSDQLAMVGVSASQYLFHWLQVHGGARLGGTNIEASAATSPSGDTIAQARAVTLNIGTRIGFWSNPEYQWALYAAYEHAFVVPEEDEIKDDFLEQSFYGIGWIYLNPHSVFHEGFVEVGGGKSENLADEGDRLKIRGHMNLGRLGDWNVFTDGSFDANQGRGKDDLRITLGLKRDASALVKAIGGVFGLDDKGKPQEKGE